MYSIFCISTRSYLIYYFEGICCHEGFGGYSVKVDDEIIQTGGSFLYSDEIIFKLTPTEEDCEDFNACTDHEYVPKSCLYKVRPCDECGANLAVIFDTDGNAAETSWSIIQEDTVLMSGGPYSISYAQYNNSECLPFGTYSYNIFDSYGDGLSACFKNGSSCGYSLAINDNTILSNDGSFGLVQSQIFGICTTDSHCDDGNECTEDTCDVANRVCKFELDCSTCDKVAATIVINTDLSPNDVSWKLSNAASDISIASMGPFQKAYTQYEHTECLQGGKYIFTAYDTSQDGLTRCDEKKLICGYHLIVDDKTVVQSSGINFEQKDHKFSVESPTRPSKKHKKEKKKPKTKKKKKTNKKKKKSRKKQSKKKKKAKSSKEIERLRLSRRPFP